MSELMGMKNILVINDEAHHCYREKPDNDELDDLLERVVQNSEDLKIVLSQAKSQQADSTPSAALELTETPVA